MSAADRVAIGEVTQDELGATVALLHTQLTEHAIAVPLALLAAGVRGLAGNREFGRVLVARLADRVVGVAVLSFLWTLEHGGAAAWLDELYVEPAVRNRGIGEQLTRAAIEAAAAAGCLALDLEVDPGRETAVRLYERLGFRRHQRERWVRSLAAAATGSHATSYSRDHRPFASFDHLSLGVNDLARSKAFYDAALAPLGIVPHEQIPGEVAYGPPGEPPEQGFAFYIGFEDPDAKRRVEPAAGVHVAFRAPDREAVRRFHAAGLAAGGSDLGAPGLRPRYRADCTGLRG